MQRLIKLIVPFNPSESRLKEDDYELLNFFGDVFRKETWEMFITEGMEVKMRWKDPLNQHSLGPQLAPAEEEPVGAASEPEDGLGEAPTVSESNTEEKGNIIVEVNRKRHPISYQEGRTKEVCPLLSISVFESLTTVEGRLTLL